MLFLGCFFLIDKFIWGHFLPIFWLGGELLGLLNHTPSHSDKLAALGLAHGRPLCRWRPTRSGRALYCRPCVGWHFETNAEK